MPDLIRGMDVSSWQPTDLTALITEHKVEHVVVRMYLPFETPSQDHSVKQVASAIANGCSVSPYIWAYRSADPVKSVSDSLELARFSGLTPQLLWIDCETYEENGSLVDTGPDTAWLRAAVRECHRQGVGAGIYTGLWYLQDYLKDWLAFVDFPLWLAVYDNEPTLDNVELPDGWNPLMLWGKQFSSDPVDLNVFRREVIT